MKQIKLDVCLLFSDILLAWCIQCNHVINALIVILK